MSKIRFVVLSDSKGKNHGINEKVLTNILKEICKLYPHPEFIVLGGDNVAGSIDEEILADQLGRLRVLIERYLPNILLCPVAGNHEVNNGESDDRYEKIMNRVYYEISPDFVLKNYNRTVYYKNFGEIRLIVLNSFRCNSVHKIDREQLRWLEEAASCDTKYKIVFVHSPAFPTGAHLGHCLDLYPEDRDAFWRVIDSNGVDIVFSGHEHNYSRRKIGSTYQVITGGGGEKLKNKYKSKEGIIVPPVDEYHFIVVDVMDSAIKVLAVSSEGKALDEFSIAK